MKERRLMRFHRFKLLVALAVALAAFPLSVAHASNDWVDTELRTDLSSVANAHDYITDVYAVAKPSSGAFGDFTTGWLGADIGSSSGFSQVGLMTDSGGVYWFVYSYLGVTCLRGSQAWGSLGCKGAYGDYATLGGWQQVELVTYGQGYWIARVYNSSGSPVDIARINSSAMNIVTGFQDGEEGYSESSDPDLTMNYLHWHPKYMTGSGWQDWPASPSDGGPAGANNYLQTQPTGECPGYYGANIDQAGDNRYWQTTNGAPTCSANPLF